VLFPNASIEAMSNPTILYTSEEDIKKLLHQLDTLEIEGLGKIVLRKSQRQIEQSVSWNVFRRDNYSCRYCAKNDVPLTVDHVVLWETNGDSVENNLISACRKCNKTRGNMPYPEWITSKYYDNMILGFGSKMTEAHKENEKAWELANLVPLRKTQRSR